MQLPTIAALVRPENSSVVTFGSMELYFSYQTLIAFRIGGQLFARKNDWGPTTGKHFNAIPGINSVPRLDDGDFAKVYEEHIGIRLDQVSGAGV